MKKKIRIAFLACSKIAKRSVLPALANIEDFELIALASRDPLSKKELANNYNCSVCTYEELVNRDDIDAVYISSPVGLHYEWAKKLIESGKHVLVEKSFTSTYFEAVDLIETASKHNLVAMEALVYVFHPLYKKIIDIVRNDKLGNIRLIEGKFGFPHLPDDDIRYDFKIGGGAILDALIYPLSFSLNCIERKIESYTANIIQDEGRQVDTSGFIQLNWDDCSSHISYGFGFTYRNEICIWGDKGTLKASRVFSRPKDFINPIIIERQGSVEEVSVEAGDHFEYMLKSFADKVNGIDESGLNEGSNILNRMKIISNLRDKYIEKYKVD